MEPDQRVELVATMTEAADRFDELADVAELMGDDAGALRLRRAGADRRRAAMDLLDEPHGD